MSDPAATTLPLDERLVLSVEDFIGTPIAGNAALEAARVVVAGLAFKRADEDTEITPSATPVKTPALIVKVTDSVRVKKSPIRSMRLEIHVRVNWQTEAGARDEFLQYRGAVEALLNGLNLQTVLSSSSRAIAVMLAVRNPGILSHVEGSIRRKIYPIDIRAVGLEHTLQVSHTADNTVSTVDSTILTADSA